MAKEREVASGDYVQCKVHVGGAQYEWCNGIVAGVRDTNFDVQFDPPAGPMKVGMGLFHKEHQGNNWRFDPNPPSTAETSTSVEESKAAEGSSDAS